VKGKATLERGPKDTVVGNRREAAEEGQLYKARKGAAVFFFLFTQYPVNRTTHQTPAKHEKTTPKIRLQQFAIVTPPTPLSCWLRNSSVFIMTSRPTKDQDLRDAFRSSRGLSSSQHSSRAPSTQPPTSRGRPEKRLR
jgi:hypothetical protein